MLPHSNSSASAGLYRAKSTSSLLPRYSTSNESSTTYLERAHYQALAAASHAFEQAHERALLPQDHQHQIKNRSESSNPQEQQKPQLARQRSVRFTGPTAEPSKATSITRRQPPLGETDHVPQRTYPHSSRGKRNSDVENYITALPQEDESGVVVNPSSYRRLKKSKSMWSISKSSQWVSSLNFLPSV